MRITKKTYKNLTITLLLSAIIMVVNYVSNPTISKAIPHNNILAFDLDSPEVDLPFPFKDGMGGPDEQNTGGLYLNNPSNVES